jgi:DNA-binding CsgD family transcriptional regulator
MKTPQGWLSLYLSRYRASRDFSDEEKLCLDLLTPHLHSAATQNSSAAACLFVDLEGQVVTMDPQAEALLDEKTSLSRRISTFLPDWILKVLTAPFDPLQIDIREEGLLYRATLSPAGIGRLYLFRLTLTPLKDPLPVPAGVLEVFSRKYRLSPREVDVLACVVSGKQMKEMACQIGLALDTVKEYLRSLYRKVGVDGRGPLLALLFSEISKGLSLQASAPAENNRFHDHAIA